MAPEAKTRRRGWAVALASALLAVALAGALLAPPLLLRIRRMQYPLRYASSVDAWSGEFGVDPFLVYAVIHTESGFNAKAQSRAGARGLMQMTEETFHWLLPRVAPGEDLTFDDLFVPEVSIRFGCYYLSISLARYGGDLRTAAAAYHSGWGSVDTLLADARYTDDGATLTQFPYRQMSHYVSKVCTAYDNYRDIYEGAAPQFETNEEKT